MTTPAERSRAFLAGLELIQALLSPKQTPRVPVEVREWARSVLRHYPTASELQLALESAATAAEPLGRPLFDTQVLEAHQSRQDSSSPLLQAERPWKQA